MSTLGAIRGSRPNKTVRRRGQHAVCAPFHPGNHGVASPDTRLFTAARTCVSDSVHAIEGKSDASGTKEPRVLGADYGCHPQRSCTDREREN